MKATTKWQVDAFFYGASTRRFIVYGGTIEQALSRVEPLVPDAHTVRSRRYDEADNPLVYVDGRAAPGA